MIAVPRKGPIAAAELLAELGADPDWLAMRAAKDRELVERRARLRAEEQPLLDELASLGIAVESVWRLNSSFESYEAAIPVLLSHLEQPYSPRLREGIARALGSKAARPTAWAPLLAMVRSGALSGEVADGVMAAISAMAQPADLGTLIALIKNRSLGSPRLFLVGNLMRSKKPEARATLAQLEGDPDLHKEIAVRLKER